jgi:hypothetical protein
MDTKYDTVSVHRCEEESLAYQQRWMEPVLTDELRVAEEQSVSVTLRSNPFH